MALVVADRVREYSATTGTGTLTLSGAPVGYQTFSNAIGNGNTTYYTISNPGVNEWEVGIGTVGAGTLARTTLISSSTGSFVSFTAGNKDVFCTYPAERSVFTDNIATLTSKTMSGLSNTFTDLPNSAFTNSSLTIGSTTIALGATSTTLAGLTGVTSSAITDSGLTSGRVTFAGTGGLLSDSANLTWNGSTFAITGGLTASADSSFTSTGALLISKGTTAQQPGSPSVGMMRYNTTTNQFEGYSSGGWGSLGSSSFVNLSASGSVTLSGGTANGVAYLNGSKVLTTGSALTFDGANFGVGGTATSKLTVKTSSDTGGIGDWDGRYFTVNPAGGTRDSAFAVGVNTSTNDVNLYALSPSVSWRNLNYSAANHVFNVSGSEQMRLTSTGLGIGTSSPVSLIDGVTNLAGGSDALTLQNQNTGSNTTKFIGIKFKGKDTVGTAKDTAYIRTYPADQDFVGSYLSFFTRSSDVIAERMRIDSSGNVGIGTSAIYDRAQISGNLGFSAGGYVGFYRNGASSNVFTNDGVSVPQFGIAGGVATGNSDASLWVSGYKDLRLLTNATERMRIDSSGNLLVGITSTSGFPNTSSGCVYVGSSTANTDCVQVNFLSTGGACYTAQRYNTGNFMWYQYSGGNVGSISTNGTATSFNTSSDYRLKENIQPMQNALATVAQLNPVTYNWKADGSDGQGFIAHELQAVVPDCVTGEKDAVDKNGKPIYQGIDTSFLVATLTKAIQELNAKVESLEAQLKGNA